ncbi:F-box only protein 16-like [Clavelina lepadiformis]|uniref:F-box only protein 16-like n=1 Tax=Clavelina lepadiformis TaxID=159417 RepID=UPI0040431FF2
MAFAPPMKTKATTNLAKSTWTPMNHPEANLQVFEERREIIKKWFQKWQDTQKRIIVDDILRNLSTKHLVSLNETLNAKFPQEKFDFTRIMPRVLTLYIFSFLDPRTLCRCAQVSWYWNYLTELDCLWRPKCLKFGWYPTYQPSPFEEKIWKRFYVNTVHELNYVKVKAVEAQNQLSLEDTKRPDTARSNMSKISVARSSASSMLGIKKGPTTPSSKKPLSGPKWQPPPWKGSDPHPIDTMRYNYLDNMSKGRKKKPSGLPDSRPSSKQSKRPQSATGSAQHSGNKTESISVHNGEANRMNCSTDFNITSVFPAKLTTNHSIAGGIPSPRLNRDFHLPQYNGPDTNRSARLTASSAFNQTSQYGTTIASQVNRPNARSSYDPNMTVITTTQPEPSYTRQSIDKAPVSQSSKTAPDMTQLSIDAGTRPQPVARHSLEKRKRVKDVKVESESPEIIPAKSSEAISTSDANDLKGNKWVAPNNSNSDDDDN